MNKSSRVQYDGSGNYYHFIVWFECVCTKDNVNDKTDLPLSLFKILWCMRIRTGHCNINKVGRKALRTENLVNLTTFTIFSDQGFFSMSPTVFCDSPR